MYENEHARETHFHMSGSTPRLVLTQRQKTIRNGLLSSNRLPTIYHLPKYIFYTFSLRESRHQSLCDASVCAFQVFDWESFAVTVRHYCLQPKSFDSNVEESIISSTSIYFSSIIDGDDDVDTPCWIKLDVLPALEQGQGNVTQGKGLLVMSCKEKVTCHVTQAVVSVSLSHFWCPCHSRLFFRKIFLELVSSSETAFVQRKS